MKKFLTTVGVHIPLPMLGLAASYGVYSFNALFVPVWVAALTAAAFELVYIAMSFMRIQSANRAMALCIIGSAVGTSILWNVLAGWFHLMRIEDLSVLPPAATVALSVVHGLPLAMVAASYALYLSGAWQVAERVAEIEPAEQREPIRLVIPTARQIADEAEPEPQPSLRQQAAALGVAPSTLSRRLKRLQSEGEA